MELFETTGVVEMAEILFDGTRSKGAGVVQFSQIEEAQTAIGAYMNICLPKFKSNRRAKTAKFQNYMYGGRPLSEYLRRFNGCGF